MDRRRNKGVVHAVTTLDFLLTGDIRMAKRRLALAFFVACCTIVYQRLVSKKALEDVYFRRIEN